MSLLGLLIFRSLLSHKMKRDESRVARVGLRNARRITSVAEQVNMQLLEIVIIERSLHINRFECQLEGRAGLGVSRAYLEACVINILFQYYLELAC